MIALAFIGSFVGFGVLGLLCWVCSDVPMAMREIAINTRLDPVLGRRHTGLLLLGMILRIVAAGMWFLAVVIPLALAVGGERLL